MKSPLYFSLALLAALVGPVACGCSNNKPDPQTDSLPSAPETSSASNQQVRSAPAAPAPAASQAAPSSSTLSGQGSGAAEAPGVPSGEPADGLPTEDGSPSKLRETGESLWRVFGGALGGLRAGSDGAAEGGGAAESEGAEDSSESAESRGEQNLEAPLPNAAP